MSDPRPVEALIEGCLAQSIVDRLQPYRKKVDTMCVRLDFAFRIRTVSNQVSGDVSARAGDYICRTPNGGWYPVPAETFDALYEEVDPNGSGQSDPA